MKSPEIEDTYAEAFDGLYCRILVTAERGLTKRDTKSPFIEHDPLRFAAYRATASPSTVVGRIEAGIESWLPGKKTPDGREGAVLQFWGMHRKGKDLKEQCEAFWKEVAIRIRQDILSASGGTTRIFDWFGEKESVYEIDTKERVGDCGGGYESEGEEYGREYYSIPLMMGHDFRIDKKIRIGKGVSGANLWFFCESVRAGREAGRAAMDAMKGIEGISVSFYVCPSGSMVANYGKIGPPTNYEFCPSLKGEIKDSKVPEGVKSIPEIVINGTDMKAIEEAMGKAMKSVSEVEGVVRISAGNYEGNLGEHKIHLKRLL